MRLGVSYNLTQEMKTILLIGYFLETKGYLWKYNKLYLDMKSQQIDDSFIYLNLLRMNEYMVHADFPQELTKEFFALIPAQRRSINNLFNRRSLTSYSMAFDEAKLWLTVSAENLKQVYAILAELPLLKFMKVRVYELTYNENVNLNEPKLSLN